MEFDDTKENIQPLACGRNASILQASITHTTRELNEQRRVLEATIHAYNGDDPLEPWYNYVSWIEQMFPSGGKESGLTQVLSKCLRRFESEERYYQDRRMIKLFIKFIYSNIEPLECFQQLYNGGIGTMVADFYIAWAYCYDSIGQMQKADEIFRRGIDCRAEPLDDLKEAYHHFKYAVGERTIYKNDNDALQNTNRQLEERRLALSSLRAFRKHKGEVGSIRTGAAIKSYNPGTVQTGSGQTAATNTNSRVTILKDENADPNAPAAVPPVNEFLQTAEADETKSSAVIRSIVDNLRHQENEHEPGPWNKVHDKKNAKKLLKQKQIVHDIGFSIHEDIDMELDDDNETLQKASLPNDNFILLSDEDKHYEKPFKYPKNFVNKNRPQTEWVLPITTEVEPESRSFPFYNKCMVYPRPNREFQMEELYAYRRYKKLNTKNAFTRRYDAVWNVNDISTPFRMYPNFARKSNPQKLDTLDVFQALPHIEGMFAPTLQIYDGEQQEEFQLEELMAREWLSSKNRTVMEPQDMDETHCASSNNEQVQRRKSFFPVRRSLAIRKMVSERAEAANVSNEKPHITFTGKTQTADAVEQQNGNFNSKGTISKPEFVASEENVDVVGASNSFVKHNDTERTENTQKDKNVGFKLPMDSKSTQNKALAEFNALHRQATVETTTSTNCNAFASEENFFCNVTKSVISSQQIGSLINAPDNKRDAFTITNENLKVNTAQQHKSNAFQSIEISRNPHILPTEENVPACVNDFPFKLPPLRPNTLKTHNEDPETGNATSSAPTLNKLPFEIFVEEGIEEPNSTPFDTEETCSTQMFNICLKSQSASTPKFEQKTQKRQFNVLREVEPANSTSPASVLVSPSSRTSAASSESPTESGGFPAPQYSLSPQSPQSPDNEASSNLPAQSYSPPLRKQLSTILETSEHGTHSTATTKSSNGTNMSEISEANTAYQNQKTQIEAAETTRTKDNGANPIQTEELDNDLIILPAATMKSEISALEKSPKLAVELTHSKSSGPVKTCQVRAISNVFDNFCEKQDEVGASKPSNLQFSIFEDPTETVPKITLNQIADVNAVAGNFERLMQCDDLTIENIAVKPVHFQEDKTETANKFLGARIVPEDRTEPLPCDFLNSANRQTMNKSPLFSDDDYNTLEFFRKSPIKFSSVVPKKDFNHSRTQLTPLNDVASKRICIQETPVNLKNHASEIKPNFVNTNKNLLNAFMNDFTLPTNSSSSKKPEMFIKCNAKLHDSFLPEFSCIEDTQPTHAVNNKEAEASIIEETQPTDVEKLVNDKSNKDLIYVAETQEDQRPTATSSKGAIPKIRQINKSYVNESLLAPTAEESFSKPELAEFKRVDFLMSQCSLQPQTSTALPEFTVLEDDEELRMSKRSKQTENTSKNFDRNEQDKMKSSQTENRCEKFSDSFLMNASSKATATNNNVSRITKSQTSATPLVDNLLSELDKSNFLDVFQKSDLVFKQPNAKTRESLIPRFVNSTKKKQLQVESDSKSNQNYSLLTTNQWPQTTNSNNMAIFDLNAESDTFSSGINMLKNSTMLLTNQQMQHSLFQEPSLHIKAEPQITLTNIDENLKEHSNSQNAPRNHVVLDAEDEMSIYYKTTPRTPQSIENNISWSQDGADEFLHQTVDLNETAQIIETKCIDPHVNPFDMDLISAFLENVEFVNFLRTEHNTMLVGQVQRLKPNAILKINNDSFKITKLIGQGNYGSVYCGINTKTDKRYAFKQERPPNYWEYYICLELQDRIKNDDILMSYMKIEQAQIGNNASIFVSAFATYGSIISVCNKVKKFTTKNVDEYVVMHLTCELLEMIDHLHAAEIIHADLKADNFLLMRKLSYNSKQTALHLIDFGVSIDMRQFKPTQAFTYVHHEETFKCIEMREQRPWTYQLDLYGVAGVIHVLLYGKYMEVEKKKMVWLPKQYMPRYINKQLWEHIFQTLLNIPDCRSMPNLQELRQRLKQEMADKERFVISKIAEFNKALDA